MKKILLPIFALVAMVFAACGGDDTAPAKIAVTGITLDKTMLALEIGEEATVKATIEPTNATNKKVEWSIADATIASVNNGEVKGLKEGETALTAKTVDGNFTATIPVKVVTEKVAVEEISMIYPLVIKEGQEGEITIGFSPINATNTNATITLNAPDVLSVEYKGNNQNPMLPSSWPCYTVKGLKAGKCNIKAVSEDGGFEYECTITVLPVIKVTEIKIGPENASIEVGETKQFAAAINPSDADNKEVEWSSSDTSIATVNATSANYIAEVTGVGQGTATITATAKDGSGVTASTTVTVTGAKPTALTINGAKNPDDIYTWHGKEFVLDLTYAPADADITRLYWSWTHAQASSYPNALKYDVQANSAKLSLNHSTNNCGDELVWIRVYDSDTKSNKMTEAYIHFRTLVWLYDGNSPIASFVGEKYNYNWNGTSHTNGLTLTAYYNTNGNGEITPPSTEAHGGYANYYIPSSEYTLTSSDESKIKVTKNDDGKSWKIERLNTTDLVAVTLTYKCGDHTQTYTINLIP